MRIVAIYLTGLVFGLGISISGMANPAKVLNFFDLAGIASGTWDPSLALVMASALTVTFVGYRMVLARKAPMLDPAFHLPTSRIIDAKLIGGSALFGVGWGIAGFCPGGALPALGTLRWEVAVFIAALLAGMMIARALQRAGTVRKQTA